MINSGFGLLLSVAAETPPQGGQALGSGWKGHFQSCYWKIYGCWSGPWAVLHHQPPLMTTHTGAYHLNRWIGCSWSVLSTIHAIKVCVWTQHVGSLAPFPEPIACWGCGVFPHRISPPPIPALKCPALSIATLQNLSAPPAAVLPGVGTLSCSLLECALEFSYFLYSASMPCHVISFDVLVALGYYRYNS